jgi:hypothetical protein
MFFLKWCCARVGLRSIRLYKKNENVRAIELAPHTSYPVGKQKALRIRFTKYKKQVLFVLEIHVHRTGTPLSPGTGSISAVVEKMTSDSSPGDVKSGLLLSFVVEVMICRKASINLRCLFSNLSNGFSM